MFRRDYYIVSEMNGKVLDIKGGNGHSGADIVTWPKNPSKTKNQLWYSDPQGFIRSALNDFAFDGGIAYFLLDVYLEEVKCTAAWF